VPGPIDREGEGAGGKHIAFEKKSNLTQTIILPSVVGCTTVNRKVAGSKFASDEVRSAPFLLAAVDFEGTWGGFPG
jgi:hypothetical protein